ncbi:hypothetical protein VT85_05415 [Planctomyces sp. SH-PL62]|nr:hypothetical protein VT85_05415 [Planctomyces sp. SH-PL62]
MGGGEPPREAVQAALNRSMASRVVVHLPPILEASSLTTPCGVRTPRVMCRMIVPVWVPPG